jgi:hypothetical protein
MWLGDVERPLGYKPAPSRFCDGVSGYAVIYAASAFETAFIETVVRDRFVQKSNREIPLGDVMARCWANLATLEGQTLKLLDLRGSGCMDLGAPTDAVNARNHAAGRALGRAIFQAHENVDGLLFSSRLVGGDCYAIVDRAVSKLTRFEVEQLKDHDALPGVLREHSIRLVS